MLRREVILPHQPSHTRSHRHLPTRSLSTSSVARKRRTTAGSSRHPVDPFAGAALASCTCAIAARQATPTAA
eukprot:scaffold99138_cov30-Tisochrysis_lutea.AAC.7